MDKLNDEFHEEWEVASDSSVDVVRASVVLQVLVVRIDFYWVFGAQQQVLPSLED